MKRTIIMLALAASLSASATTEKNDTVVIKNAKQVTIISNDTLQKVEVKGVEGNDDYIYRNTIVLDDEKGVRRSTSTYESGSLFPKVKVGGEKDSSLVDVTAHFGWGFVIPTNVQDGISFSDGSSIEIFFTPIDMEFYLNHKRKDYFSVGLGFDWRNYRMTNDTRFVRTDDGDVALGVYPPGAKPKFSRIKVFSINFPVLYHHKFDKDWGFGLGGILNWNTYASIKSKYKLDGGTHKFVDKDINHRKFTVDMMGIFYNPLFDFYVKYSPMDVLKEPSVKFRALSVGFFF